jgi:cyclopropane fatty-acyl-phospholipid synthase-like methyltransferase
MLEAWRRRVVAIREARQARRHALVGPARLWQMKRASQIDFLRATGLRPHHRLLDLGCGTLRGGIPLIEYLDEGHYVGVDVRATALAEARKELRDAGLESKHPRLVLCPDLSRLALDHRFDRIWAFSVLIHMSDDVVDHALGFVSRHLAPGGAFYANVLVGEGRTGAWEEFPVIARPPSFYRRASARHGLAVDDVGALRDHGHVSHVESQDGQRILRITRPEGAGALSDRP